MYSRIQAGVRQAVLPYSGKWQAGCTPVFRQVAVRLYSHVQAGDRQVVLPYSDRG